MTHIIKIFLISLMGLIILLGVKQTGLIGSSSDSDPWPPVETSSLSALAKSSKGVLTPYHLTVAPQLSGQTIKGKVFSFENLKGQAFLLNFWASWCAPCREEFPDLISAVRWSQGRLSLVAISNDSSKEDIQAFLNNLEKEGVKWQDRHIYILWDPDFKWAKQFNVAKWPETFILDSQGRIVKKQVGTFSFQKAKPFLSPLLHP